MIIIIFFSSFPVGRGKRELEKDRNKIGIMEDAIFGPDSQKGVLSSKMGLGVGGVM